MSNPEDGLHRRLHVIDIPSPGERKKNPELKDLIAKEGSGILNWAIEGLVRLRDRGRF